MAEEASDAIATEFVLQIQARFSQASTFPLSGAPRPHLGRKLRVIFHGKYGIYYVPKRDEVIIVRVLHGSRDIPSIVDEGGFAS